MIWKRRCVVLGILGAGQGVSMLYAAALAVSVVASDPTATIGTTDSAAFTFTREGSTAASLAVHYSLGGSAAKWTDYRRLPEGDMPVSITIPAGEVSATLTIYALANSTLANPQTVSLSLLPNAAYTVGSPNSAFVNIQSGAGSTPTNPPPITNNTNNTNNTVTAASTTPSLIDDESPALPKVGANRLRILSPTLLEVRHINSKQPDPARVDSWDFINPSGQLAAPPATQFAVTVNGQPVAVQSLGFKRRPLYAPLVPRDLRIENHLYLQLATPLADHQTVEVKNPGGALWPATMPFVATADPLRHSPIIHVNQEGYVPSFPKKAMVGYYLGNLGEMDISASLGFKLVDATTGTQVYQGALTPRPDYGYIYTPIPYQKVLEADFSSFTTPGRYRLVVPGLGASFPFAIDEGVAMAFARAYELGIYHQRCGTSNSLPFTRFTHDTCHTAPASVPLPQSSFGFTWATIANYAAIINPNNPPQIAPRLSSPAAQLFPFVRQGAVDVSGGHHDAGDYSKYTINSAGLAHTLMFSADSLAGVAALDNLGIPESGDGISDVLQNAKLEADYLSKLQDSDGGFYFLVYPKNREYESGTPPDQGDAQVVWPKTTSATAAAVAALAQCGSSPLMKQHYPQAAASYMAKATLGWKFLTNAIALYGKTGAYQKITHYGDNYADQDELAWAAAEMYVATGDPYYQQILFQWFPDPTDSNTFRWGWWRMSEGWGHAIRSYAFAVRSGRLQPHQLNQSYLAKCLTTITNAGNDALLWSQQSAYGTSFPLETKRYRSAGWYFSAAQAFDIAVAQQITPRPDYLDALVSNLNYEGGGNPVNVTYITGLGWKRQREIVDQYSMSDRRVLPKTGIPLGNVQNGFVWVNTYGTELAALCYPSDLAPTAPVPFYDRWGDAFNTTTEFVVLDQARGLGVAAYLATLTATKTQPWKSGAAQISTPTTVVPVGEPVTVSLQSGLDLSGARIVWEGRDHEPAYGSTFTFTPQNNGTQWVEAEAQWPDGRRVFAEASFTANSPNVVWVEDAIPAGGVPGANGGDSWSWISSNPAPYSGTAAHQSALAAGLHEHWFDNATATLDIGVGDTLYAYVYLDPANPPSQIMLGWNNGNWEHRAYWGANHISYGINGTDSRRYMGPLPTAGQWVRLEVPAGQVGLEGSTLKGMDFSAYGGRVTWDSAGKTSIVSGEPTGPVAASISRVSGGNMQFNWPSVAGKIYRVAYKNHLTDATWTELSGDIAGTGAPCSWTDSTAANASQRFYLVYAVN
ncbi:MAG: glycoside hydrolase family 9 protein [Verrucomicrobia bacterium]|nr:glycoside hydrolase family 9 protein [Verrucomicrobiota bacterium]